MKRNWKDWVIMLGLVGMVSAAPQMLLNASAQPFRNECDTADNS